MKKYWIWGAVLFFSGLAACKELPVERKIWDRDQIKYMLTHNEKEHWKLTHRSVNGEADSLSGCGEAFLLTLTDSLDSKNKELLAFEMTRSFDQCETNPGLDTLLYEGTWQIIQENPLEDSDSIVFFAQTDTTVDTLAYHIYYIDPDKLILSTTLQSEAEAEIEVIEEYELQVEVQSVD